MGAPMYISKTHALISVWGVVRLFRMSALHWKEVLIGDWLYAVAQVLYQKMILFLLCARPVFSKLETLLCVFSLITEMDCRLSGFQPPISAPY